MLNPSFRTKANQPTMDMNEKDNGTLEEPRIGMQRVPGGAGSGSQQASFFCFSLHTVSLLFLWRAAFSAFPGTGRMAAAQLPSLRVTFLAKQRPKRLFVPIPNFAAEGPMGLQPGVSRDHRQSLSLARARGGNLLSFRCGTICV